MPCWIIFLSQFFPFGLAGAAAATAAGQLIGGIFPIIYFARKNGSPLRLTKAKFNGRVLASACANGSSEMVTNLSASVVSILYNFQLMSIAGENGVAAYGVIMYVNIIFMANFSGLFYWQRSDRKLPLWRGKPYRTEKHVSQKLNLADRFRSHFSGTLRACSASSGDDLHQL